jgi:uncharacterized caspase-like protein
MANRAIVVGIQSYPELTPKLKGPEYDARTFFEWVTTAGGVNPNPALGHATLILSSQFKPPAVRALDARPTSEVIREKLEELEEIGDKAADGRAGERLYLYLSGHGFGQDLNTAALLMANATQSRTRNHVPGRLWADHFYISGYFDEILLFMDCCRERHATAVLNGPGTVQAPRPPANGRRFYGFAAKDGRLAVERNIDGQTRGVFTATLLDALRGEAAESDGRITAESLQAYLYSNMKEYLTDNELANGDVAREPDLFFDPPTEAKNFVITQAVAPVHHVSIPLPPTPVGAPLELRGEKAGKKFALLAQGNADATGTWTLPLAAEAYVLSANGVTKVVTVKGRGVVHVTDE